MSDLKAGIEAALEHGIDIFGRRVFLHGDVEAEAIGRAIRGLYMISDIKKDPVELYVSSYGGDVDEAFALHDVTRTIKCPVHTVALGKCMSAAPLLVACGQAGHRFATENTSFMLHDGEMDASGRLKNVEVEAAAAKALTEKFARLLARYSKKDRRHWLRVFSRVEDTYFDAVQALEWGLIDGIWDEKG